MEFEDITCSTCLYSFLPEDGPVTCRRNAPTITEPVPETNVGPDEEIVPENFPEIDPAARCGGGGKWLIHDRARIGVKIVDLTEAVGVSLTEDSESMRVHRPGWLDFPQWAVEEEPAKKPTKTTKSKPKTASKKARTRAGNQRQESHSQSGK